jgi:hypothetical protein
MHCPGFSNTPFEPRVTLSPLHRNEKGWSVGWGAIPHPLTLSSVKCHVVYTGLYNSGGLIIIYPLPPPPPLLILHHGHTPPTETERPRCGVTQANFIDIRCHRHCMTIKDEEVKPKVRTSRDCGDGMAWPRPYSYKAGHFSYLILFPNSQLETRQFYLFNNKLCATRNAQKSRT